MVPFNFFLLYLLVQSHFFCIKTELIFKCPIFRGIINQILVYFLQIFINLFILLRVAGKRGLVGFDGFYFHIFYIIYLCALILVGHRVVECAAVTEFKTLKMITFLVF